MIKNVFVVNCDRKNFEKNFTKKKNSDIINHDDIRERLTNNDAFKTAPSSEIIQFQIIKKINSFTKCKKSEFLFFYQDDLSMDFVDGLKKLFSSCEYDINFHLVTDESDLEINEKFHTIQKMEYDKI